MADTTDSRYDKEVLEELKNISASVSSTNRSFKSFFATQRSDRLKALDTSDIGKSIGSASRGIGTGIGQAATGGGNFALGLGSLFGAGLGGLLTGAGIGIGAGAAGIALLISTIEDVDTLEVKNKVKDLLSISDEFEGGTAEFFSEGGTFFSTMLGIGVGLAAFGFGTAAAGVGMAIAEFSSGADWPNKIKENVATLLSIQELFGSNSSGMIEMLGRGGALFLTLGGIGAGLAAFSVASATAGVAEAVAQFSVGEDWPNKIKENVATLLSIQDLFGSGPAAMIEMLGRGGALFLTLGGIGAGLAAFSLGTLAANATGSYADALSQFQNGTDWATNIKNKVATLLSITVDSGLDTVKFIAQMTGIAAGLTAFAASNIFVASADAVSNFISVPQGKSDWTELLKMRVHNLLSILDKESSVEKSAKFTEVMGNLAGGLAKFAGGTFLQGLTSFFTSNPFEKLHELLDRNEEINATALAIRQLNDAVKGQTQTEFLRPELISKTKAEELTAEYRTATATDMSQSGQNVNVVDASTNNQSVTNNNQAISMNPPSAINPMDTGGRGLYIPGFI